MDKLIKRLCKFFNTDNLDFIGFSDNIYTIHLDTWRYSVGRTLEEVVNNFFEDYKNEIKLIEELKEEMR